MCWSVTASIAATALSAVATGYAAKKKVPKIRVFALGFFTLMELLQAASYIWLNRCDMSGNVILTYLSLLHIAFQVPTLSAVMLSYVSKNVRKKWYKPVMTISFVSTALMMTKLLAPLMATVPLEWMCNTADPLCGIKACTYKGDWHLAWSAPLLAFDSQFLSYFLPVFILPFFYGSWRVALYLFVTGPLLMGFTTNNGDEAPAIWCLFSVIILPLLILSPLRSWFETPLRKN